MKIWYFSFLFFIFCNKTFAQDSPFAFNHLSEKDGLSYNLINCFLKDSRGFLWIGTYDGLNRYDGAHFIVYKKTKDPNSLVHNTVLDLIEDKKGNIWGCTDNGIFCYNPIQNKFTNYTNIQGVKEATVVNIVCDKAGDIWATTYAQLLKLNTKTNQFQIENEPNTPKDTRINRIKYNGMLECPSGKGLWLATFNGLFFYDTMLKKYIHSAANDNNVFTYNNVSAISKNKAGQFWMMDNTSHNFICFDPISRKIIKKIPVPANQFKGTVATLFEDSQNNLWFSTWQFEIGIIKHKKGNEIIPLKNSPTDENSIATEFFWDAMEDEDGNVWIGNVGGISKFNTKNNLYKTHWLSNKIPELNKFVAIVNFFENPIDKSLWVTTNSSLLIHYQPITGLIEKIDLNKHLVLKGVSNANPMSIAFVNKRIVFINTKGTWFWDEKKKMPKPFDILPIGYKNFIPLEIIQKNDSIYYFNNGEYLLEYNNRKNAIVPIYFANNTLINGSKPYVNNLIKGKDGKIWADIGVNSFAFINDKKQLQSITLDVGNDHTNVGYFYDMVQEADSLLWIAKKIDGLYKYNFKKNKLTIFTEADGLVYDHIMSVALDKAQNVWTIAYNKISVFIQSKKKFYNFEIPLVNHNYSYINKLKLLSNGSIFTNLKTDLVEFFPNSVTAIPKIIDPTISSVNIVGKEVLLHNNKFISLKPDENSIILKFGLMTDRVIFPYTFKYKLDGVDTDWIENQTNAEAVYNKLPSGNFVFHLKADAKNGLWASKEFLYTIHISTPFYKSFWFFALIAAGIAASAYAFYKYRLSEQQKYFMLRQKAENLEKEKTIVQYESLKQHLNPHFLFNSLTSLRSLIKINPGSAVGFLDGMSKVYRYVLKSGEKELATLATELDFAKTYVDLQKTRFDNGLIVNFNIAEDCLEKYIAPVTLQNLIENAIKHNTADLDSPLVIDIYTENEYLIIKNNLQRYRIMETSNKRGLNSLKSLYKYYTEKAIEIADDDKYFTIKIPLI